MFVDITNKINLKSGDKYVFLRTEEKTRYKGGYIDIKIVVLLKEKLRQP